MSSRSCKILATIQPHIRCAECGSFPCDRGRPATFQEGACTMMRRVVTLSMLAILVSVGVAEATNDVIANAVQAALGEKRSQTMPASGLAYFGYRLEANRSYAAFCWPSTLESQGAIFGQCGLEIRDGSDTPVGTDRRSAQIEPFPKGGAVSVFTPTTTTSYFVRINSGAGTVANMVMIETTLAAPWYFYSPSAGYDAFVEIRNHTAQSVTAVVRAYTGAGAIVGSALSIPMAAN